MKNSLKAFRAHSGSPREDIDWNNRTLRERSRMLYMSSPIATSAINTNRTKIIGLGLSLKSSINRTVLGLSPEAAKEWQRKTEAEFSLWASRKYNCDAMGMNDFYELQQLALASWLLSGDVFLLFQRREPMAMNPYTLRLRLIEADRVATPELCGGIFVTDGRNPDNQNPIYDGVEVDPQGLAVAYHIRSTYPYQATAEPNVWTRVEAIGQQTGLPNILHIMNSERPDQYRGVPYLAQVIEPILQLRRYIDSSLMTALVQTFFTAWITTETDPSESPWGTRDDIVKEDYLDEPPPLNENEYAMGAGTVNHLRPNEKISFGNPSIPMAGFDAFVKTFCEMIGSGLELPYDVLIKEYNSSYSSARGALQDAWDAFRMRRNWFVSDFCQPVYEVWLAEAVARGRIHAPGFFDNPLIRAAWSSARWIGPVQSQLDPLKEAKAAVLQIQNALKTHEQVAREMGGGDWEENAEQLSRENELLAQANASYTEQLEGEAKRFLEEKDED